MAQASGAIARRMRASVSRSLSCTTTALQPVSGSQAMSRASRWVTNRRSEEQGLERGLAFQLCFRFGAASQRKHIVRHPVVREVADDLRQQLGSFFWLSLPLKIASHALVQRPESTFLEFRPCREPAQLHIDVRRKREQSGRLPAVGVVLRAGSEIRPQGTWVRLSCS